MFLHKDICLIFLIDCKFCCQNRSIYVAKTFYTKPELVKGTNRLEICMKNIWDWSVKLEEKFLHYWPTCVHYSIWSNKVRKPKVFNCSFYYFISADPSLATLAHLSQIQGI